MLPRQTACIRIQTLQVSGSKSKYIPVPIHCIGSTTLILKDLLCLFFILLRCLEKIFNGLLLYYIGMHLIPDLFLYSVSSKNAVYPARYSMYCMQLEPKLWTKVELEPKINNFGIEKLVFRLKASVNKIAGCQVPVSGYTEYPAIITD